MGQFAPHRVWLAVSLLAAFASTLAAQPPASRPAVADAPVRYDTDLLPPAFHESRRDAVLAWLPGDAFAVVFSNPERPREGDVSYEYRQSSNLYYLTGIEEPGAVLLLAPAGIEVDGQRAREVLLVPARDTARERWTGRRFGPERAQRALGVERAVAADRLAELLGRFQAEGRRLYHLPLPPGVVRGSALDRQLDVLRARFPVLDAGGSGLTRVLTRRLLETASEEDFRRNRRLVERLDVDSLDGTGAQAIVRALLQASSFAQWTAWRAEHVDRRYADGVALGRRLEELRMVKTADELRLLRRAIDITAEAQRAALRVIRPGTHEYQVEALIEHVFHRSGAEHAGFPSIIASGENAVVLHYETNRRRMEAGDLVVMDVGAEYHGYTADVTRTVPVSGQFSPEQRAIYELVLRAQEAGIRAARAGASPRAPDDSARAIVVAGLRQLGLIAQDDRDARRFFNHGATHYLGLDVHDVGTGGPLLPGTVITVEPGIYIPPAPDVDPRWWNIGVRIEDDVLVTEGEPLVLSAGAPKTVAEIEELMRRR